MWSRHHWMKPSLLSTEENDNLPLNKVAQLVHPLYVFTIKDVDLMLAAVSLVANSHHFLPKEANRAHHPLETPTPAVERVSGWRFWFKHVFDLWSTLWSVFSNRHWCWCISFSSLCTGPLDQFTFHFTLCCKRNLHQDLGHMQHHVEDRTHTCVYPQVLSCRCYSPHSWCWFFHHSWSCHRP